MSFETLAALDGKGIFWGVEVSFDNFATVTYRWGTHSGIVEGDFYERRITKMGDITRGIGTDGMPAASNFDVYLDNTDFAVDWLADMSLFASQVVRAKYRLRLGFWDPSVAVSVVTKVMGVFSALDQPELGAPEVRLTLADDLINGLSDLLRPPTINDWMNASDSSECPFIGLTGFANNVRPSTTYGGSAALTNGFKQVDVDFNLPWPLMWGAGADGYVIGRMIAPGIDRVIVVSAVRFLQSTTGGSGVSFAAYTTGQVGNLVSVTINAPSGGATTVTVTTLKDPDGNVTDIQVVVSPKAGETNTGLAAAVNVSAANLTVIATVVGTGADLTVARAHAYLTGGFGYDNQWIHPDGTQAGSLAGEAGDWRQIMVCATAELSDVTAQDCVVLEAVYKNKLATFGGAAGQAQRIPDTSGGLTIWAVKKSQTFSASGYSWRLFWIEFSMTNYYAWASVYPSTNANDPTGANGLADAIDHFNVYSLGALSSVNHPSITPNPCDVARDLIEYYSNQRGFAGGPVDATSFNRARQARLGLSAAGQLQVQYSTAVASGAKAASVQATATQSPGQASRLGYNTGLLRQALAEVCSSFDIDVFVRFDGKAGCSARVADFAAATTTYPHVDEQRVVADSVSKRTPSADERWAYFNSAYFTVPGGTGADELGPFRNEDAITAAGGKVVEKHLGGTWWPQLQGVLSANSNAWGAQQTFADVESRVWASRGMEAKARPVVQFDTDFTFLATDVELGDDFLFTWTRGSNSVQYSSALFRCDGMVIHPESGTVTITEVYMDDLRTQAAFLLDDENYLARVSSSVGRTATVVDGSSTVTFASGSLITDGVQAGDDLILKDATESAVAFKRNRALKIASITDATHLVVTGLNNYTDFGGGGAVATWEIRRSKLTYPTVVSDATHYPSGGAMYGKVCNDSDVYSDASAANELLDG